MFVTVEREGSGIDEVAVGLGKESIYVSAH